MVERLLRFFSKEVETESDLVPKGVARTVSTERTDFNSTFMHIRQEQLKLYDKLRK